MNVNAKNMVNALLLNLVFVLNQVFNDKIYKFSDIFLRALRDLVQNCVRLKKLVWILRRIE